MIIDEHVHLTIDGDRIHWSAVVDDGITTYCEAAGVVGDVVIVDIIETHPDHRRQRHATRLIQAVEHFFEKPVQPSEITPSKEAIGFWRSILGEEVIRLL